MDARDTLKSMLQNLINDESEQANMDLHDYLIAKTQEVIGAQEANTSDDDKY